MLRSAASPGSVGFGRHGGGASGLLMTLFPAGHHCVAADLVFAGYPPLRASGKRPGHRPSQVQVIASGCSPYLILDSRNSTCFFATGSYFFFTNLSVIVR